jgi:hypothetical protein
MGRSPERSQQIIDNKNFLNSPEALGHWSATQGRIEIIDEEKDLDEMDPFMLKDNNYNRSIKECPSEQEEDSFTLGASFDQRSSVNKRLSP